MSPLRRIAVAGGLLAALAVAAVVSLHHASPAVPAYDPLPFRVETKMKNGGRTVAIGDDVLGFHVFMLDDAGFVVETRSIPGEAFSAAAEQIRRSDPPPVEGPPPPLP